MNAPSKAAAHGSLFSPAAALLVIYWAWGLFPTATARLVGYAVLVLLLAPVAAASALAVWWYQLRQPHHPIVAMTISMLVGVLASSCEGMLLHLIQPSLFPGSTISAANFVPGLITGAIVGYARSGVNRAKAV